MKKIDFYVSGHIPKQYDAAIVLKGEDPTEALLDSIIQSVSINIEVTCGDVTLPLAAWQDPDHWSEDWQALGIDPDDVPALIFAAISES